MCTSGTDYKSIVREEDVVADEHPNHMARIRSMVKESIRKNYEKSKKKYDIKTREISYAEGDTIWIKNRVLSNAIRGITAKFAPEYRKCTISRRIGSNSYEVAEPNGKIIGIYDASCFKH